jgi:Holliday junction resolvasome RuvABC endonuclease subunit
VIVVVGKKSEWKKVNPERILALDTSTKTGYAVGVSSDSGIKLEDYGTLEQIHEPEGKYPSNYVMWSYQIFKELEKLIVKTKPDSLVIEETSKGSKNAMSQKILEFCHFLLAQHIMNTGIKSSYIMTGQWRKEIGCQMNDEEKLRNKEVRKYKKEYEKKHGKKTAVAYDINGKRIGITGKKKVNIRIANEIFGDQLKSPLKRKDEDQADALGLLACYHMRRLKPNKSEEVSMEDIIKDNV